MAIRNGELEEMVSKKLDYLWRLLRNKNKGRVETQPRCKIQYPMKNRSEDADKKLK